MKYASVQKSLKVSLSKLTNQSIINCCNLTQAKAVFPQL